MTETKYIHGLQLVNATRLSILNHNPHHPSISVNGSQLSYRDIELGPLKLSDSKAYTLDESDGNYYQILNTNSEIVVKEEAEVEIGKLAPGQIIPAGSSLFKQQSPAPFAYIDKTGRLGSSNLWNILFEANVMGWVDVDKAASTYNHGLVPAGDSVHEGQFLRRDGQWGQPSLYTGSVSETFLSLRDSPVTYTDQIDKYLRVSYAEGGSVIFDDINTDKVPESTTNLYYTQGRVDTRIADKLQDRSIASISVSGIITCNEILAESDRRLKTDIKNLIPEDCLDTISQIDPKEYRFKTQTKTRYGVIAQEIEKILPSLVTYNNEQAAVNYLELIPFLIGSIKELKEQVDCLKYDLEILKSN
jgi:hypothetical protein